MTTKAMRWLGGLAGAACLFVAAGCAKKEGVSAAHETPTAAKEAPVAKHEHHPPHGGTPVVLGEEAAHVELVRDAASGRLQAYVLDGELENFIRVADAALTIVAAGDGGERTLTLLPVADAATGETAGDTSLFAAQADWLKTTPRFTARLTAITVRGTAYRDVGFAFPEGNDHD
jgi:hypothetical protein